PRVAFENDLHQNTEPRNCRSASQEPAGRLRHEARGPSSAPRLVAPGGDLESARVGGPNTTDLSPAGRMLDAARPDGVRRGRRLRLRVSGSRGAPKRRFGGWSGRRPVVAGLLRPGRVWSSAG